MGESGGLEEESPSSGDLSHLPPPQEMFQIGLDHSELHLLRHDTKSHAGLV